MALVLGLNNGSSFDGVDAVVVEITDGPDGYPARPRFIGGNSYAWPDAVAGKVLRAFDNKLSVFELCRLNYVAGAVYAEAARSLMREMSIKPGQLEAIGYDGQTIYQEPPEHDRLADFSDDEQLVARWLDGPYACGLQIGEPAIVAAACETVVVTQFRPMDHALGGTGAPLMQYLDYVAFRDIGPLLTLNIGGIANCQLADAARSRMMAFDTGPGNVMLDHVSRAACWASRTTPTGRPRRGGPSTRRYSTRCSSIPTSTGRRRAALGAWISAPTTPTRVSSSTGTSRRRTCWPRSPTSRRSLSPGQSPTTWRSYPRSRSCSPAAAAPATPS